MRYAKSLSLSAAVFATASGLLLVASQAQAQDVIVRAPAEVVREVRFADLNLTQASGQRALHRRIGEAVTDVCIEASGGFLAYRSFQHGREACATVAWRAARPQIARAISRSKALAANGTVPLMGSTITLTLRN